MIGKVCTLWRAWWLVLSLSFPLGAAAFENITNEWVINIGARSDTCPAVAPDGTIYFGTSAGELWAVQPSGTRKWIFKAGREIQSSPAVANDGTIFFGSRNYNLYAVDAEGRKKWQFKTGAWIDASPALGTNGDVYFGSWDKTLYALDRAGRKRWDFKTQGEIVSSAAIGLDGSIYFGSHDRKLYALSADGKKEWDFAAEAPILSSPALNEDGTVYFTSVDGFLYALTSDGKLKWRLRTGGITESSPVIGLNGTIYVGVNYELWNIAVDGKKNWARWDGAALDSAAMALADGSTCYMGHWGTALDMIENKELLWMFPLYCVSHAALAPGPQGILYGPTWSYNFTALRTKVPLAKTPWPKFRGNPRNTGNLADANKPFDRLPR
jgi:outer membrane protein assembly factor BamB